MGDEILKANFKLKKEVKAEENKKASFQEEYEKKVFSSLGGSMVFMERDKLVWEGDQ
ncbi:MAG: hypothetical protein KC684_08950 [Candidatus Omnitrophica bacterium]|nr:hypothetical protein [Candidatus Omnitrophota bacterium]MCA9406653.1 hypothetical protein [Candidatus Omnitrophota bacterium]